MLKQNNDDKEIAARFFEAINVLKANKIIKSKLTFSTLYNIDRHLFYMAQKRPGLFKVSWIKYIAEGYGVNPIWILTNKGKMFDSKKGAV